ncbi:MAG: VWA domain-containing protein, partial [Tissierellia bacterium]|nr:VWA domain-containing protein [Tissierellia bacterium]
ISEEENISEEEIIVQVTDEKELLEDDIAKDSKDEGEEEIESADKPTEQYSLSKDNLSLIYKFKSIISDDYSAYKDISSNINDESILAKADLNVSKIDDHEYYTNLRANFLSESDCIELVLESVNNEAINEINFYVNENVDVIEDLFTDEQKHEINEILEKIDLYRQQAEDPSGLYDLDTYSEIMHLLDQLTSIKAYYSMQDQGLAIKEEEKNHLSIENTNPYTNELKFMVKVKDKDLLKEDELLKLFVSNASKQDQFSVVYTREKVETRTFVPLQVRSTRAIRSPETIPPDDIAPQNYLNLLENMPDATAEVVGKGNGVNWNWDWGKKYDIVTIPQDAELDGGGMWAGDWNRASSKLFTKLAGDAATAVRFKPSKVKNGYSQDMDIGWIQDDLDLSKTSMWIKVKYTNAAYYKNELVDAEATIRITPMKNRSEGTYYNSTYGNQSYYPIIQFSHNLYKGWAWQNVREINVDLVFRRKNGEDIRFESSTFDGEKASYFTINSLNEAQEQGTGRPGVGIHSFGPEYVRPDDSTITGAYVIPGSNIQTSYYGGEMAGTQNAYNGGTGTWNGDDPSHPNWSQNSVLFTIADTNRLNFTMGNLMRDPEPNNVPRTSFVWTSMSTQSFANYYVDYKDIEINKTWSDGGENHGPIKVNLLKNYKVKISYPRSTWGREEKIIEVKNLLADMVEISNETNWKSGFYRIPDEASQNKLIRKLYKRDNNQLKIDAGENFPSDIPNNFNIDMVSDFSYGISEVTVPGYSSSIEKSVEANKDIYSITNSKDLEGPTPLIPNLKVKKQIDYLGDGKLNPDTNIQKQIQDQSLLDDIYRLYLEIEGEKVIQEDPLDLLFVLDGSSSMTAQDMMGDTSDVKISRRDAMLKLLNRTDVVTNFLNQNAGNRVAFLYFDGYTRNNNTTKRKGYTYNDDAHIIRGWSNIFNKDLDLPGPDLYMGTNYQAGLMLAEDLINESKRENRRQAMIFLSDGVPTFWINENGDRKGSGSNSDVQYNVAPAKKNTKQYLDGFYERHPNIITYTVGVSRDINHESPTGSQSPEVLKYMAEKGNGSYIGVESDTQELINRLRQVIEAAVTDVRVEDILSDKVELLREKIDFKLVKVQENVETILWENDQPTLANGQSEEKVIASLGYDEDKRKIVVSFNPGYKLEDDVKYILSYNIKTNQKAKDDYLLNDSYDYIGDDDTDYRENKTSSGKAGFRSNHEAKVYYNGDQEKEFPHPVVKVNVTQSFELPKTGGNGSKAIKNIGLVLIFGASYFLIRKKRCVES